MNWFQPAVVSHARETIKNLQHYDGDEWFISKPTLIFRAVVAGSVAIAFGVRSLREWACLSGVVIAGAVYLLESARAARAVRKLFVVEFCSSQTPVAAGVLEYIARDLQAAKDVQHYEIISGDERMAQLLQAAVEKGTRAVTCFLVEKVRPPTSDTMVALWLAVQDREVARAVQKTEQFPINVVDSKGNPALFYALQRYIEKQDEESKRSVLLLLEHGAEVLQGTTTFTVRNIAKDLSDWLANDATLCLALESARKNEHQYRHIPSDYSFKWGWHELYLRTFALAGIALFALRNSRPPAPFCCLVAGYDVWYTERRLRRLAAEEFKSALPSAEVLDEIGRNWIKQWINEDKDVSKVDHEGRSLFDRLLQGEITAIDPYTFIDRLFEKSSPELLEFYYYKAIDAGNQPYANYMLTKKGRRVLLEGCPIRD